MAPKQQGEGGKGPNAARGLAVRLPNLELLERFGIGPVSPTSLGNLAAQVAKRSTPGKDPHKPVAPPDGKETPWTPNGPNNTHVPYLRSSITPLIAGIFAEQVAKPTKHAASTHAGAGTGGGAGAAAGGAGGYANTAASRARATSRQVSTGAAGAAVGAVGKAPSLVAAAAAVAARQAASKDNPTAKWKPGASEPRGGAAGSPDPRAARGAVSTYAAGASKAVAAGMKPAAAAAAAGAAPRSPAAAAAAARGGAPGAGMAALKSPRNQFMASMDQRPTGSGPGTPTSRRPVTSPQLVLPEGGISSPAGSTTGGPGARGPRGAPVAGGPLASSSSSGGGISGGQAIGSSSGGSGVGKNREARPMTFSQWAEATELAASGSLTGRGPPSASGSPPPGWRSSSSREAPPRSQPAGPQARVGRSPAPWNQVAAAELPTAPGTVLAPMPAAARSPTVAAMATTTAAAAAAAQRPTVTPAAAARVAGARAGSAAPLQAAALSLRHVSGGRGVTDSDSSLTFAAAQSGLRASDASLPSAGSGGSGVGLLRLDSGGVEAGSPGVAGGGSSRRRLIRAPHLVASDASLSELSSWAILESSAQAAALGDGSGSGAAASSAALSPTGFHSHPSMTTLALQGGSQTMPSGLDEVAASGSPSLSGGARRWLGVSGEGITGAIVAATAALAGREGGRQGPSPPTPPLGSASAPAGSSGGPGANKVGPDTTAISEPRSGGAAPRLAWESGKALNAASPPPAPQPDVLPPHATSTLPSPPSPAPSASPTLAGGSSRSLGLGFRAPSTTYAPPAPLPALPAPLPRDDSGDLGLPMLQPLSPTPDSRSLTTAQQNHRWHRSSVLGDGAYAAAAESSTQEPQAHAPVQPLPRAAAPKAAAGLAPGGGNSRLVEAADVAAAAAAAASRTAAMGGNGPAAHTIDADMTDDGESDGEAAAPSAAAVANAAVVNEARGSMLHPGGGGGGGSGRQQYSNDSRLEYDMLWNGEEFDRSSIPEDHYPYNGDDFVRHASVTGRFSNLSYAAAPLLPPASGITGAGAGPGIGHRRAASGNAALTQSGAGGPHRSAAPNRAILGLLTDGVPDGPHTGKVPFGRSASARTPQARGGGGGGEYAGLPPPGSPGMARSPVEYYNQGGGGGGGGFRGSEETTMADELLGSRNWRISEAGPSTAMGGRGPASTGAVAAFHAEPVVPGSQRPSVVSTGSMAWPGSAGQSRAGSAAQVGTGGGAGSSRVGGGGDGGSGRSSSGSRSAGAAGAVVTSHPVVAEEPSWMPDDDDDQVGGDGGGGGNAGGSRGARRDDRGSGMDSDGHSNAATVGDNSPADSLHTSFARPAAASSLAPPGASITTPGLGRPPLPLTTATIVPSRFRSASPGRGAGGAPPTLPLPPLLSPTASPPLGAVRRSNAAASLLRSSQSAPPLRPVLAAYGAGGAEYDEAALAAACAAGGAYARATKPPALMLPSPAAFPEQTLMGSPQAHAVGGTPTSSTAAAASAAAAAAGSPRAGRSATVPTGVIGGPSTAATRALPMSAGGGGVAAAAAAVTQPPASAPGGAVAASTVTGMGGVPSSSLRASTQVPRTGSATSLARRSFVHHLSLASRANGAGPGGAAGGGGGGLSLRSSVLMGAGTAAAAAMEGVRGSVGAMSIGGFSALSGPQPDAVYPSHGYVERAAEFGRWEAAMLYDLDLYDSLQLAGFPSAEEYEDPHYEMEAPAPPPTNPPHLRGGPAPTPTTPPGAAGAAGGSATGSTGGSFTGAQPAQQASPARGMAAAAPVPSSPTVRGAGTSMDGSSVTVTGGIGPQPSSYVSPAASPLGVMTTNSAFEDHGPGGSGVTPSTVTVAMASSLYSHRSPTAADAAAAAALAAPPALPSRLRSGSGSGAASATASHTLSPTRQAVALASTAATSVPSQFKPPPLVLTTSPPVSGSHSTPLTAGMAAMPFYATTTMRLPTQQALADRRPNVVAHMLSAESSYSSGRSDADASPAAAVGSTIGEAAAVGADAATAGGGATATAAATSAASASAAVAAATAAAAAAAAATARAGSKPPLPRREVSRVMEALSPAYNNDVPSQARPNTGASMLELLDELMEEEAPDRRQQPSAGDARQHQPESPGATAAAATGTNDRSPGAGASGSRGSTEDGEVEAWRWRSVGPSPSGRPSMSPSQSSAPQSQPRDSAGRGGGAAGDSPWLPPPPHSAQAPPASAGGAAGNDRGLRGRTQRRDSSHNGEGSTDAAGVRSSTSTLGPQRSSSPGEPRQAAGSSTRSVGRSDFGGRGAVAISPRGPAAACVPVSAVAPPPAAMPYTPPLPVAPWDFPGLTSSVHMYGNQMYDLMASMASLHAGMLAGGAWPLPLPPPHMYGSAIGLPPPPILEESSQGQQEQEEREQQQQQQQDREQRRNVGGGGVYGGYGGGAPTASGLISPSSSAAGSAATYGALLRHDNSTAAGSTLADTNPRTSTAMPSSAAATHGQQATHAAVTAALAGVQPDAAAAAGSGAARAAEAAAVEAERRWSPGSVAAAVAAWEATVRGTGPAAHSLPSDALAGGGDGGGDSRASTATPVLGYASGGATPPTAGVGTAGRRFAMPAPSEAQAAGGWAAAADAPFEPYMPYPWAAPHTSAAPPSSRSPYDGGSRHAPPMPYSPYLPHPGYPPSPYGFPPFPQPYGSVPYPGYGLYPPQTPAPATPAAPLPPHNAPPHGTASTPFSAAGAAWTQRPQPVPPHRGSSSGAGAGTAAGTGNGASSAGTGGGGGGRGRSHVSIEAIQRLLEADLPTSAIAAAVAVLAGSLPQSAAAEAAAAAVTPGPALEPSRVAAKGAPENEQPVASGSEGAGAGASSLAHSAAAASGSGSSGPRGSRIPAPPHSLTTAAAALRHSAALGIRQSGAVTAQRQSSSNLSRSHAALLALAGEKGMPPKALGDEPPTLAATTGSLARGGAAGGTAAGSAEEADTVGVDEMYKSLVAAETAAVVAAETAAAAAELEAEAVAAAAAGADTAALASPLLRVAEPAAAVAPSHTVSGVPGVASAPDAASDVASAPALAAGRSMTATSPARCAVVSPTAAAAAAAAAAGSAAESPRAGLQAPAAASAGVAAELPDHPLLRAVRLIAQSMLIVVAGAAGATAAASSVNAVLVRPEDLPGPDGSSSILYRRTWSSAGGSPHGGAGGRTAGRGQPGSRRAGGFG